jgi:hypothetical protein
MTCRSLWTSVSGPQTDWKSQWTEWPILRVSPLYIYVADPDGGPHDRRIDRATLAANGHALWHIGPKNTRRYDSCIYFDDKGKAAQIAREAMEAEEAEELTDG